MRIAFVVTCLMALAGAACSDPAAEKAGHVNAGKQLFEERQYQRAILEYRAALTYDPILAAARYGLAQAYEASGDVAAAFREYVRAADVMPDDASVQLRAASYLLVSGRLEDAKTRIDRVLSREPRNVEEASSARRAYGRSTCSRGLIG